MPIVPQMLSCHLYVYCKLFTVLVPVLKMYALDMHRVKWRHRCSGQNKETNWK